MNALVPKNLNQKSFRKIARQSTTGGGEKSEGMLEEGTWKMS
ncbi:hypothetical protein [Rhodoferax ferrireducens]|nr:hypothetical protein [Rhodoferax ferrireducens]